MSDSDKLVTKQSLKDFYNQIQPYLNGSAHLGYTPIGTVISVMGNSAPKHYLKCDGATYNIADYPELADYFEDEFGLKNKFGGNGTTTFAVPDLRGEFLRGTGTNGHTNQGNGATVGTHQNATEIPYANISASNTWVFRTKSGTEIQPINRDVDIGTSPSWAANKTDATGSNSSYATYSVRPTNTSVLYCIATKNIYIDALNDYSTGEKVIGTWIDGKPLYQKVIVGTLPNCTTEGTVVASNVNHGIANVDLIFITSAFVKDYADWPATSSMTRILPYTLNSGSQMKVSIGRTQIQYANGAKTMNGSSVYSVAQYTKTTDT